MSAASDTYWNSFQINDKDMERVYALMLERGEATQTAELAQLVIATRVREEQERRARLGSQAVLYQPKGEYPVGQRLIFGAFGDTEGVVSAVRASDNPRIPPFQVVSVTFDGGKTQEFAACYNAPHLLNQVKPAATGAADETPEAIYTRFGKAIEQALAAHMRPDKEFVELGDKWILRGLLSEVNVGFLNIAEAAIEQNNVGMTTAELARVLEMEIDGAKRETVLFSLDYALSHDERFVDVGPRDQTRWYLHRLVPPEVLSVPRVLEFADVSSVDEPLPPELETILSEIQDDAPGDGALPDSPADVSLVLTYPHRRAGSLPLTRGVRALFPLADKPMLVTLVDENNTRVPAWIVPDENYVYGLKNWYDRNKLNPGALLELAPREEPFTAALSFQPRREGKSLWVRTAKVENNRLTFGTTPRPVAFKYDEDMLIVAEDQNGLDRLTASNYGDRPLEMLLLDLFPELVKLGGGSSIHAKTLYSAVNFARRVGARAVFSALANGEAFSSTSGGYYVLQQLAARAA